MMPERKPRRRLRPVFLLLLLAVVAVAALATLRVGPPPSIELAAGLPGIGPATPVSVRLAAPGRGLAAVRVELEQDERTEVLAEVAHQPRPPWAFWGARTAEETLELEVGSRTVEGLREGEATLRVVAERAPTWLRRPAPAVEELTLPVRLSPPVISVLSTQHNVAQGGSGVVVYRVGETAAESGVRAGERWFPGFPLPAGAAAERFAFFGVPFDLDDPAGIRLEAADELGNRASRGFVDAFEPRPVAEGTIRLSQEFMQGVVPEILANTPGFGDRGDLLASYLAINGELRRQNRARLAELAEQSRPELLWSEPFLQMRNAQVMSPFAVRRTYLLDGQPVDEQYHLGFDLASVRRAPVEASNSGVVMLAEYFGIYGNAVIIDHGYGLMSLYGHLSSIDVAAGEPVERGQVIGRTGETGLAGGDHLHFGILLQGLPVNPLEWWDRAWIRDRVAAKMGGALD